MESSLVSPGHNIQHSYVREAPSTLSASAYCDLDNYPSPNLDDTYWGNLIPSITASFCNTPMETGSQQEQVVAKDEDPEFKELADQVLDMEYEKRKRESMYKTEEVNVYGRKLSSLGQNIPDSFCNTPMETGSQQEQVVAKDEDPEFKELADQVLDMEYEKRKRESMYKTEEVNVYGRKLSSLGQNIPDSFCNTPMETGSQQEQVVAKDEDPEFKELADQVLDMEYEKRKRESMYKTEEVNVYGRKLSSLGQNIPDSFCNTPMETGSQQTSDGTGVEASKSAAYQSMNVLHDDMPMTTYDANMPLQSTTNVNPTQVDDQNKRQNQTVVSDDLDFVKITPFLFNATPSNAPNDPTIDYLIDVYDVLPATGEQNIPDSFCNTPICKKCHQRAKQVWEKYNQVLPTIGMEQPLHSFYISMKIVPCLGECKRTPNVSVLHNTNCVLYNMPLLKKLQKNNPQTLQKVNKNLTNINMDRDDFKNLLFHEKLSKMLDKIECAVAYIESCCNKYIYLVAFKLQLTALVKEGLNSHPNPDTLTKSTVIKFLYHMEEKIAVVDELIFELMKKDMSYYQLKVDLNNMLEIMSQHEYAEVGESYYHGLELESRIDTFIENYKKVSESVKKKLDIQNNYTDCESISFYYKDYKEYLNLLINSLDETNSVPDNNSGFVDYPIISNPHLKAFYNKMNRASYDEVSKQNRNLCKLTTESDICLFMKDLSRFLDNIEDLDVKLKKTLDILRNSEQTDVRVFKQNIRTARKQILCCSYEKYNTSYLSLKELGRMEMKKTWVYINTKVPIQKYSLSCMRLCMLRYLSRGSQACETVKENLSSNVCKEQGSKFQFLEEYIDYNKAVIDVLKEKWFAPDPV